MTLPIVFRPLARAEYDDARDFYASRTAAKAAEFVRAVQGVLDDIAARPDRNPIADEDIREAPVPGFPYCVYYVVEPDRIRVVSVFHLRRDPSVWQGRR